MQVSVETTSGLERRLTVGVPAEKVDSAVEGKLQEAQKNVRLDGFRPGKVPMREVKRRFGSAVRNEVLADVMRGSGTQAEDVLRQDHATTARLLVLSKLVAPIYQMTLEICHISRN